MMNSNQPFQRVDDGIGAGLVGGAVVGGAMAGAAHKWGQQGLEAGMNASQSRYSKAKNTNATNQSLPNLSEDRRAASTNKLRKAGDQHISAVSKGTAAQGALDKRFAKGWKGRGATYAGSVLAGGIIGATADSLNN